MSSSGHSNSSEACWPLQEGAINAVEALNLSLDAALWTRGDESRPLNLVIDAQFMRDGDVLVLSEFGRELWKYDAETGDVVSRVGRSGSGPGEFGQASSFNLLGDGRIALVDARNRRVVAFSGSGDPAGAEWLPEIAGGPMEVDAVVDDALFLITRSDPPLTPDQLPAGRAALHRTRHVLAATRGGTTADTLRAWVTERVTLGTRGMPLPFRAPDTHEIAGARVAWLNLTGDVAWTVDLGTDARRCYRWEGRMTPVTRRMRDSLVEDTETRRTQRRNGEEWAEARLAMIDAMFDGDLVPPNLPAFVEADPGPDGTVWLTMSVPTEGVNPARRTLIHVSADGRVLRRASLPVGWTLWAAGNGRLLLGWYGASMEEWIGVFRISS